MRFRERELIESRPPDKTPRHLKKFPMEREMKKLRREDLSSVQSTSLRVTKLHSSKKRDTKLVLFTAPSAHAFSALNTSPGEEKEEEEASCRCHRPLPLVGVRKKFGKIFLGQSSSSFFPSSSAEKNSKQINAF